MGLHFRGKVGLLIKELPAMALRLSEDKTRGGLMPITVSKSRGYGDDKVSASKVSASGTVRIWYKVKVTVLAA